MQGLCCDQTALTRQVLNVRSRINTKEAAIIEFQNQYLGFRSARDRLPVAGPHADYTLSSDLPGIANRIGFLSEMYAT